MASRKLSSSRFSAMAFDGFLMTLRRIERAKLVNILRLLGFIGVGFSCTVLPGVVRSHAGLQRNAEASDRANHDFMTVLDAHLDERGTETEEGNPQNDMAALSRERVEKPFPSVYPVIHAVSP